MNIKAIVKITFISICFIAVALLLMQLTIFLRNVCTSESYKFITIIPRSTRDFDNNKTSILGACEMNINNNSNSNSSSNIDSGSNIESDEVKNSSLVMEKKFARILEGALLYKSANTEDSSMSNVYFTLPKTYFVTVLSTTDTISKVKYNDLVGWTLTEKLEIVEFTPVSPEISDITIEIRSDSGTYMTILPSTERESRLIYLAPRTSNIKYIAMYESDIIPSGGTTNIWYYATIETNETSVTNGYIYSERAILSKAITDSSEANPIEAVEPPTSENDTSTPASSENAIVKTDDSIEANETNAVSTISPKQKTILIIALCIPALLLFIMLLRKRKTNTATTLK